MSDDEVIVRLMREGKKAERRAASCREKLKLTANQLRAAASKIDSVLRGNHKHPSGQDDITYPSCDESAATLTALHENERTAKSNQRRVDSML